MGLLFGLMVVSAQFRLGGMYADLTRRPASAEVLPDLPLAMLVGVSGADRPSLSTLRVTRFFAA